jgi:hypothetical protein
MYGITLQNSAILLLTAIQPGKPANWQGGLMNIPQVLRGESFSGKSSRHNLQIPLSRIFFTAFDVPVP